jgi:hypothetical protein
MTMVFVHCYLFGGIILENLFKGIGVADSLVVHLLLQITLVSTGSFLLLLVFCLVVCILDV